MFFTLCLLLSYHFNLQVFFNRLKFYYFIVYEKKALCVIIIL
nr:MAG TPA: hypothetical protein [Caudoviricetes sp.]